MCIVCPFVFALLVILTVYANRHIGAIGNWKDFHAGLLSTVGCITVMPIGTQGGPLASIALPRPPTPDMAGRRCPVPADQVPAWPRPCRRWPAGGDDHADGGGGVFDTDGMAGPRPAVGASRPAGRPIFWVWDSGQNSSRRKQPCKRCRMLNRWNLIG